MEVLESDDMVLTNGEISVNKLFAKSSSEKDSVELVSYALALHTANNRQVKRRE